MTIIIHRMNNLLSDQHSIAAHSTCWSDNFMAKMMRCERHRNILGNRPIWNRLCIKGLLVTFHTHRARENIYQVVKHAEHKFIKNLLNVHPPKSSKQILVFNQCHPEYRSVSPGDSVRLKNCNVYSPLWILALLLFSMLCLFLLVLLLLLSFQLNTVLQIRVD